jgi:tRNA-specific 2-thiouridylase
MSGGVDSTVAALILNRQGHEVIGVTFKNFDLNQLQPADSRRNCCSLELINNARQACGRLGIAHYVIDRTAIFKQEVIDNFRDSYFQGLTPNPCVRCNALVRWPELVRLAVQMDADFIATGHYARIGREGSAYRICRAISRAKDQSYALWGIKREYLAKTLLPIGDYGKDQIREMATLRGFQNAEEPDSQDICFVAEGKYGDELGESASGDIINADGRILGRHQGLVNYTIGQRRGLGISHSEPLYVIDIRVNQNKLVVGPEKDLYRRGFEIDQTNWFIEARPGDTFECLAQIRYRHEPAACLVQILTDNTARVSFLKTQRAITPGQSAVFYEGEIMLGGGVIISVL